MFPVSELIINPGYLIVPTWYVIIVRELWLPAKSTENRENIKNVENRDSVWRAKAEPREHGE